MKIFLVWKTDQSGDNFHDLLCAYKSKKSAYRHMIRLASVDLPSYKSQIWENERYHPGLYGPDIQERMDYWTVNKWARSHWHLEETELF